MAWLTYCIINTEQTIKNIFFLKVDRFKGKLVKMIKDAGGKFDDYLNLPKIRQILLHWGYELTEKDIFLNSTN